MKKLSFPLAGFFVLACCFACSNNTDTTTTTDSTSVTTGDTSNAMNNAATDTMAANNMSYSSTKLNAADSTFVMKAAMGNMMEVQGGQVAQQNAQNERVKNFGTMMVNDHGKANQELMSLASAKGLNIPNMLPQDKQKEIDQMRSMNGAAFDKHYMGMMVTDHKKDVAEYEKLSGSASDADLKNYITKTLPVLKTHLDSAQAINTAIK